MLFSKYQGAGNDFILIDDRAGSFPIGNIRFVQKLCSRRFGIGADGLVLLQHSSTADFRMRIFNLDGSEASMCGNALRCLVLFLHEIGIVRDFFQIETFAGVFLCTKKADNHVVVEFPIPKSLYQEVDLKGFFPHSIHVVDSGVPHAVIFVKDLETVGVESWGRFVRMHPVFAPEGVNVNFIQIDRQGDLCIRTYERGVEGETLACGTGAIAAAFVFFEQTGHLGSLKILPRSGEAFICSRCEDPLKGLEISGRAAFVFSGVADSYYLNS